MISIVIVSVAFWFTMFCFIQYLRSDPPNSSASAELPHEGKTADE